MKLLHGRMTTTLICSTREGTFLLVNKRNLFKELSVLTPPEDVLQKSDFATLYFRKIY